MARTLDTVHTHTHTHTLCNLNDENTNVQHMCAFKNNINANQKKYKIDEFLE